MSSLTTVQNRIANDANIQLVEKFDGAMRAVDNMNVEKSEIFKFPEDLTGRKAKQKIGDGLAQFIIVDICNANGEPTGETKYFYMGTWTKRRREYNEDLVPTGRVFVTKGSAAEYARQSGGVDECAESLKGKLCICSEVEYFKTKRWNADELVDAQVPTIDFYEVPTSDSDNTGN